ncbi:MAG: CoA-transferase [Acidimicrobiaceae bacterium]|nr:CoA-transferase [Acidimicrobiaceae bacterium]MYC41550.1 CoA-transferase [Acidimicrobiaceae bacterium]
MIGDATLDEVCVVAIAEAFRGDGELLCNPMGPVPVIAGRLARASFEPDLMLTDTIAFAIEGNLALGGDPSAAVIEAYFPFRSVFDQAWSGKRHVVMGASQMDQYGNQNFAAIGPYQRPKAQLLGLRGAPGNLMNHPTTYWIPNQARAFSATVDVVSAPGYDLIAQLPEASRKHFEIRRVVTNLGAYDFETEDRRMRVRSLHPGVTLEQAQEASAFELAVTGDVEESRLPSDEELRLIREVFDPNGVRKAEFR